MMVFHWKQKQLFSLKVKETVSKIIGLKKPQSVAASVLSAIQLSERKNYTFIKGVLCL